MDDSIVWSTQSESQFFERKSAWSRSGGRESPRQIAAVVADILDALSAMANADGGELVVGIEDDGLATGVPHSLAQIQEMLVAPCELRFVVPALDVDVQTVDLTDGERLLHFAISPAYHVHRLMDGRCLLRIRDANVPLSNRQIPGLEKTMQQRHVERRVMDGARLSDLDFALVSHFFGDGNLEDRLYGLGLIVTKDGAWIPCLAALLLFGKKPIRWHAHCGIVFKKWGQEEVPILTHTFEGPLATLSQNVFEYIKPHIPCRDRFPFGSVPVYPDLVWQEAIVNAILHRDYAIEDRAIEIHLFEDRLEICSPGLPPRPITANRLNRARGFHLSRNPILFRTWGLITQRKEIGEGTAFIRRAMAREGLAAPVFDRCDGRVLRLTLYDRSIYNEMLLAWLARFAHFHLTDAQQRVLAYGRLHGYRFTLGHFAKLTEMSLYAASEAVDDLVRKGVVRVLKKGSDFYRILEPLYVASDVPSFLMPRLKNKGWLANRHVRRGLGVRRQTARKLLRYWCAEKWVIKKGRSAQTVYVPGERFQKKS
jgi:ATP-dependent DNA helicase RecG